MIKSEFSECSAQCITPNNNEGACVLLRQCPELYDILQNPSPSRIEYLQKSNCGFENKEPKVCCKNQGLSANVEDRYEEVAPSPPRQTSTTRPRPARPSATEAPLVGNVHLLPKIDTCGLSSDNRIYGGEKTEIDEFPWTVLLEYKKRKSSSLKFVNLIKLIKYLPLQQVVKAFTAVGFLLILDT